MAEINDNFTGAAAVWEIHQRIEYHRQTGRMLEGLNFNDEGTLKVEGEDDLPSMMPFAIQTEEGLSAGAPRPDGSKRSQIRSINQPVAETLTAVYLIKGSRKDGFVRADALDATEGKGFLEWLSLIRDAIETARDGTGKADSSLGGALMKPPKFIMRESDTSQLAFSVYLEVELYLHHYCRGERGFTLPNRDA